MAHERIEKPVYCGEYGVPYISESVGEALVTRLETPEQASDVEDNAEYPMAYADQHEDGVLVTRPEELGLPTDWRNATSTSGTLPTSPRRPVYRVYTGGG